MNYYIYNGQFYCRDELEHHGIKGMKWGVRRYQNKDGSLTLAGKKRLAKEQYKTDSRDNSRASDRKNIKSKNEYVADAKRKHYDDVISKNYDKASPTTKKVMDDYKSMTDQEFMNKYSASKEKYAKRVERNGDPYTNNRFAKATAKGARVVSKLMMANAVDDIFYGGAGKKIAKEAIVQSGRAAVTAYTMARGGYNIEWYDKQGRRVG